MSMTAGEIVWKITGDKSGFDKSIKGAEKSAKGFGKTLSGVAKTIGVAFAAIGFTSVVKKLVKLGSDAEEVGQKFGVVFAGITKDANKMAANLAMNYGMSRTEAKKLLSDTGDLLSGFGMTTESALELSNEVQMLAADLASFSNVTGGTTFASEALTKGLFGETEQMKTLGIVINQNSKEFKNQVRRYQEVEGKTLQQAKAMAILAEATKQSQNAIGDFARSSGSFAHTMKLLNSRIEDVATEIGQEMLPSVNKLASAFLIAAKDGSPFIDTLKLMGRIIGGLIGGLANFANGVTILAGKIKGMGVSEEFDTIGRSQTQWGKTSEQTFGEFKRSGEGIVQTVNRLAEGQGKTAEAAQVASEKWKKLQGRLTEAMEASKNLIEIDLAARESIFESTEKEEEAIEKKVALREKAARVAIGSDKKEVKAINEKTSAVERFMETLEQVSSSYSSGLGQISDLFGSINDLNAAIGERRIADLDEQMNRELEAAGLLEDSKEEELNNDIERAERLGDEETAAEKKKALERHKIEQKYAKKRAMIEYQVALMGWQFKLAFAIASVPLAIMQGMIAGFQLGPWGGAIFGVIAGVAAALQVAAVAAAKPKPPSFQTGGIVPGSSLAGDTISAQVNSGEMFLNGSQQKRLFDMADGKQSSGSSPINIYLGDELIYSNLYNASKNGDLFIDSRAVQST